MKVRNLDSEGGVEICFHRKQSQTCIFCVRPLEPSYFMSAVAQLTEEEKSARLDELIKTASAEFPHRQIDRNDANRFLKARKFDIKLASEMLHAYLVSLNFLKNNSIFIILSASWARIDSNESCCDGEFAFQF
jgi:hypothetical protein